MGVGCTHGELIDPLFWDAVIRFRDAYKPDVRVHGGDWQDTPSWRAGAKGTPDEGRSSRQDTHKGAEFLRSYRPTHLCKGNHDIRPQDHLNNPNDIIRTMAELAYKETEELFDELGVIRTPGYNVWDFFEFGGSKWMHGIKFNVNAARDHAVAFNSIVVHWHVHKCMKQPVDCYDETYGICGGTGARIQNMDYAQRRISTLGWSQGIVWGEFTEDKKPECKLWLHDNGRNMNQEKWRLPV